MDARTAWTGRAGTAALLALPGALTVYLSFHGGGYFPGTAALVAVLVAAALIVRVTSAREPGAGLSRPVVAAVVAMALFGAWTLASSSWSDAAARAMFEVDRVILYTLVLVLFGSLARKPGSLSWLLRGMAAALLAVCTVGLISRVLPEVWPITQNIEPSRLSYPVTYWNALALMAALGIVLCVHLSADEHEPAIVRVIAAGAVPLLSATLLLTFSRGPIVAGAIALFAYIVLARPRGLPGAALAIVPTGVLAVMASYQADQLATEHPTSPVAISQGHDAALVIGLCTLAAMVVRAVALQLDRRMTRASLPAAWRRPAVVWVVVVALVGVGAGAVIAFNVPHWVHDQYEVFVHTQAVDARNATRSRLSNVSNNGRLDAWRVAVDAYDADRLRGHGAGTYQVLWSEHRPDSSNLVDAHSLYVEVLGELGIVGLVLLLAAVLTLLAALAWRVRGPGRARQAAVFAVVLGWALHAGVDWDWEMPAVTLWIFAAAGLALALPARPPRGSGGAELRRPSSPVRIVIATGLLGLAITPALVAVSQSRLDQALTAFRHRDCTGAVRAAVRTIDVVAARWEPFEVLAYCDSRAGRPDLAIRAMREAALRDPENGRLRYGLAVVRAAAGRDPRPAARAALRLNPRDPYAQDAVRRFDTSDPGEWRRRARGAALPIQ